MLQRHIPSPARDFGVTPTVTPPSHRHTAPNTAHAYIWLRPACLWFMAADITTNVDKIISRLKTYERAEVPRAARSTMSKFGFEVARKKVPEYMEDVFNQPNAFTKRSLLYKVVSPYEVHLTFKQNIGKGNDPARYLYPVTRGLPGNEAYSTKFTRYVQKAGIVPSNYYPIPVKDNLRKNSYGKVSQGEYSKAWAGLERLGGAGKTGRGYRYFSVPDNRNRAGIRTRQGSLFDISEGIYRIKGRNNLQLMFTYAKSQPTVPKIFDYYTFVRKQAKSMIPGLMRQFLG